MKLEMKRPAEPHPMLGALLIECSMAGTCNDSRNDLKELSDAQMLDYGSYSLPTPSLSR